MPHHNTIELNTTEDNNTGRNTAITPNHRNITPRGRVGPRHSTDNRSQRHSTRNTIRQTPVRNINSSQTPITDTSNANNTAIGTHPTTERRLPSTYDPESTNRNLNRYNTCIQEEILLTIQNKNIPFKDNIQKAERQAIKTLQDRIKNKEIVITKADKGSGVVVVDYATYITKGTHYIEQEAKAYEKEQHSEQDIITNIVKTRNKLINQLKEQGVIPPQTALYIIKQLEEKITGVKFYYKIHKDTNIDTMPLRPLQSCIKAPTQHLSIVLTDILQPLLTTKNIPSFIYDSNQLLYRLHHLDKIPLDHTIISSDVSALYPSIPHAEGFEAMTTFLKQKTPYSESQIASIVRALELVITENYVTWNKNIYKQISGVAMGTPVAVAYANIFMDWVDREIRHKAPYIFEHIRYIDDNLFIIPQDKVEELIHTANNVLPPHIKFTYEKLDRTSDEGLLFLDTQLFISDENTIQSRLYTKKTDRHAYLLPTSYHPPHITHNIPAAVFSRIKKICTLDKWFQEDANRATTWLTDRGYNEVEVSKALEKVKKKDRWDMIEKIEKNRGKQRNEKEADTHKIPIVITYNQHSKEIKKVLKNRQPLLDNAFRKTIVKPRLTYRRQKNLNDLLIQKSLRGPLAQGGKELWTFTQCDETTSYRTRCPCKGKHNQGRCRCCICTA